MSDEVDVEELLRRGGTREEGPGVLESFARGAKQGITLGFGDEMSGAAGALGHGMGRAFRRLRDGDLLPDSLDELQRDFEGARTAYRAARDDVRGEDTQAEQRNPNAFMAGEFGGAAAPAVASGGAGAGWRAALKAGALEGGAAGLGGSRAELTDGDVYEYVQAAMDTGKGAALGAAMGGGAERVGAGLRWAGTKARGALDNARGTMFREAAQEDMGRLAREDGAEIARREGVRAREAKDVEKLGREQGRAMEMNKGHDKRAAREAERAAKKAGRAPGAAAPAEPDTRVLEGFEGKAYERQQNRSDKAMSRKKAIDAGENNTAWRDDAQRYIDKLPALSDPGAVRVHYLRRMLREKYGPERAERIMQRFDEAGQLRARPSAAPAASGPEALPELVDGGRIVDDLQAAPSDTERTVIDRDAFPTDSAVWLDNVRRQVDIEGRPPEPFWKGGPPLSPLENAQGMAQMRNLPEDTIPHYGGPVRSRIEQLPELAPLETGGGQAPARVAPLGPMPAAKPGAGPRYGERRAAPVTPALDEAQALRRAAGAAARVGAGTPTRNGRAVPPPAAPVERTAPAARRPSNEATGPMARVGEEPDALFQDFTMPNGAGPLRSPAMQRAMSREKAALGDVARAGYEGARRSGNVLGAILGAGVGITRESIRNPAVRARALHAFRLAHLQKTSPESFSRVGRALAQAMVDDPEKATVIEHVAMQTDPEFRSAMRAADEEAGKVSDEELVEALVAAGIL